MRKLPPMVDMARSPAEKKDQAEKMVAPDATATPDVPDYPYGLSICLDDDSLTKLGLNDEDIGVGDIVHIHGFAKVTSVSENASEGQDKRKRVELQITHLASESEDEENDEDEDAAEPSRTSRLYG